MSKPSKLKIKKILVSQPKPTTEKSPYFDLAEKYNLKIDFRPFITVKPVEAKDFRKERINILDHTAVIFTSKNAIVLNAKPLGEAAFIVSVAPPASQEKFVKVLLFATVRPAPVVSAGA